MKNYTKDITKLFEYSDIILANEFEAALFYEILKINTKNKKNTIKDLGYQLCKNIPKKIKIKKELS